jgi:DNA-binding transcriptional LysR family regulator
MSRLADLEAFIAIIEHGSLTTAARHLDRSLQAVSRALAALEEDIGVQLVHRTTRQSSPSEAGLAFYKRLKPAVAEIREAELEANKRRS